MSIQAAGVRVNHARVNKLRVEGASEIEAHRIDKEVNRLERAKELGRKAEALTATAYTPRLILKRQTVSLLSRIRSTVAAAIQSRRAANKRAATSRRANRS